MVLRDIRAAYDSRYFGASLEEKSISIWRSDLVPPVATVRPGFSGGEKRHCIDPVNRLIYSGTWEDGLTCFDYAENRTVWHRSDLIGIQSVDLSVGFPGSVFVTLEAPDYRLNELDVASGIVELAAEDGRTRWSAERGDWCYANPCRPFLVIQDRSDRVVRILDANKNEVGTAPMIHFALLDVGFSDAFIALADGAKGVRVLNYRGEVIARYVPIGRKPNCIQVAFHAERLLVFDSWDGPFVTTIDPTNGELVSEYQRDSQGTICFIDNGSRFVDESGHIFRSSNGQFEGTLKAEQPGTGQPATRPVVEPEGGDKPQPEEEGR